MKCSCFSLCDSVRGYYLAVGSITTEPVPVRVYAKPKMAVAQAASGGKVCAGNRCPESKTRVGWVLVHPLTCQQQLFQGPYSVSLKFPLLLKMSSAVTLRSAQETSLDFMKAAGSLRLVQLPGSQFSEGSKEQCSRPVPCMSDAHLSQGPFLVCLK